MRHHQTLVCVKGGKTCLNWLTFAAFALVVTVVSVATAELIWKALTGHYSPVLAAAGLVLAIMIVIRVTGAAFAAAVEPRPELQ